MRTYDGGHLGGVVCILNDACVQVRKFLGFICRIGKFVIVRHAKLFKSEPRSLSKRASVCITAGEKLHNNMQRIWLEVCHKARPNAMPSAFGHDI